MLVSSTSTQIRAAELRRQEFVVRAIREQHVEHALAADHSVRRPRPLSMARPSCSFTVPECIRYIWQLLTSLTTTGSLRPIQDPRPRTANL